MSKKIDLPKLPEQFKARWVKALRSGEYKQARLTLQDDGGGAYCCIGVALAIHQKKKVGERLDSGHFFATASACDVLGLTRVQAELVERNDDKRWSFNRIANWIEKHL